MKLKEFVDVVNRFDNKIEVRTGNEWYSTTVEELPMIRTAKEDVYESEYADREVVSVYALDYMSLQVWIEGDRI